MWLYFRSEEIAKYGRCEQYFPNTGLVACSVTAYTSETAHNECCLDRGPCGGYYLHEIPRFLGKAFRFAICLLAPNVVNSRTWGALGKRVEHSVPSLTLAGYGCGCSPNAVQNHLPKGPFVLEVSAAKKNCNRSTCHGTLRLSPSWWMTALWCLVTDHTRSQSWGIHIGPGSKHLGLDLGIWARI